MDAMVVNISSTAMGFDNPFHREIFPYFILKIYKSFALKISSQTSNRSCSGSGITEVESFEMFKHSKGFVDVIGSHVTSLSKLVGLPSITNDVTSEIIFFINSNSIELIPGAFSAAVLE